MMAVGLYRYLPIEVRAISVDPVDATKQRAPRGSVATKPRILGCHVSGVPCSTPRRNPGTINAANLRRAHRLVEDGHVVGKRVLEGF